MYAVNTSSVVEHKVKQKDSKAGETNHRIIRLIRFILVFVNKN